MRSEKAHNVQPTDHRAVLGWLICIFSTLGLVVYSFCGQSSGVSPFSIFIQQESHVDYEYMQQEPIIEISDIIVETTATSTVDYADKIYQRDDDSSPSQSSKSKPKSEAQKVLDSPGIRVVLVLFGFVFLNMIAICIHHVYQKLTNNEKSYRTVQHDISPF